MKNFEEIKEIILKNAKLSNACKSEYDRAKNAVNIERLLKVIVDNFDDCVKKNVLTFEILTNIEKDVLIKNGIFFNHKEKIELNSDCVGINVISNDSSTIQEVRSYDSSTIQYVRSYGNSTIQDVISYDSSTIHDVRSYGSSTIQEVISYDSSTIQYVISYGSSTIHDVRSYGSSTIQYVRSYDSSTIQYVRSYDSSTIQEVRSNGNSTIQYVISYDSSTIQEVISYGSSTITIYNYEKIIFAVDMNGCIKDIKEKKIYIKKDNFTIEYL